MPIDTKLQSVIDAFHRPDFESTAFCLGSCDVISSDFLESLEAAAINGGYLLCCGIIQRETSEPCYNGFCKPELITHYVVCLGDLIIDWTSRQFWNDTSIPLIIPKDELGKWWGDVAWNHDARIDLKRDRE